MAGGALRLAGVGDVDNGLDPNTGYDSLANSAYQLYARSLFSYPSLPGVGQRPVPDLAAGPPQASPDGLHYSVTIRVGATWNSSPPRQVTAADVVRGLERSCNPVGAFAGSADLDALTGYDAYCRAFARVSPTDLAAQNAFMAANNLPGVGVDAANPLTVDFTLTTREYWFPDLLTLAPFHPCPVEDLQYLDNSPDLGQRGLSDGPYRVQSYVPGRSIVFVRNAAWQAASDPIRKAYVDQITVDETAPNGPAAYAKVIAASPQADLLWGNAVTPEAAGSLLAAHDPRIDLQPSGQLGPYLVFNLKSTAGGSALARLPVRQALSYALNRPGLVQAIGGSALEPPLSHLIPSGTDGSLPNFDPYPYNPPQARMLLGDADVRGLSLRVLYRSSSWIDATLVQSIQSQLASAGVTVTPLAVSAADFYERYVDNAAAVGQWDMAVGGFVPDWFPSGAASLLEPILASGMAPPLGSNFGGFSDGNLEALFRQAQDATSSTSAAALWHQADVEAMAQAALYPIASANVVSLHATRVRNTVFVTGIGGYNLANVWLLH